MGRQNQIFAKNKKLWEKVFMEADKGMTLQEDGKNYGEFLLDTIESAKDKFTEDDLLLQFGFIYYFSLFIKQNTLLVFQRNHNISLLNS